MEVSLDQEYPTELPETEVEGSEVMGLRVCREAFFTPSWNRSVVFENSAACVYVETSTVGFGLPARNKTRHPVPVSTGIGARETL